LTRRVRIILIAAVLGLAWLPGVAWAAGLGVTPGHLELEAYPLIKATGALSVINTSTEAGQYRIYAEGEAADWLSLSPAEFTLKAGETQTVAVTVSPPLTARGDYQATVSVVSFSDNPGLEVGCGVKVPVSLMVSGLRAAPPFTWVITAVALAVSLPIAIQRRRRRHAA
jgi:hypothetical protein